MIQDIIIIKDGLPLLTRNFSNSQKVFSNTDNIIMMSGFFSALNSFSDQFEELGTISELKLSKNNCRLSFLKDNKIPNLIYLATFDENSKGVNVQRVLRKLSLNFSRQYNMQQILNWRGRKDTFKQFEGLIEEFVNDELEESEQDFKGKVIDLFQSVERELSDQSNSIQDQENGIPDYKLPTYYAYIPTFRTIKKINPRYYLTGEVSIKIFNQIDGKKSINQIAEELVFSQEKVYNICKNLVKIGFILFS